MEVVLQQINKIQGVTGCFVCDEDGKMLCQALPPEYDTRQVQEAAGLIADSVIGINEATGGVGSLDLRFANNRIIVKPVQAGYLLLVCEQKINLQLLSMSLSVAQKKLEKAIQAPKEQPIASQPAIQAAASPQPAEPREPRRDGNGFILVVDSMTVSSRIPWDQMKEEVAISELLAQYLSKNSIPAPIKKLKLTNKVTHKSKVFMVRLYKPEAGLLLDDRIALTLAASEALEAKPGDVITLESAASGVFSKDPVFAGL